MPGKFTLALPLVILLLLGALSGWIERTVNLPTAVLQDQELEPESIVENFRALKTGADGRAHYRLEARTLKHFSSDQPSELVEPRFTQLAADGGISRASARHAVLSAEGNTVTLAGQVRFNRSLGNTPGLALKTERLVLRPEEQRVSAPGPVELSDRHWSARAGRLELDNQKGVATLTGRVRAVYRHASS